MTSPQIIILGGPNGAGKSTLSRLTELSGLLFLNADDIEKDQGAGPLKAGKTLLAQLREAAADRKDFVIETTLAGKWLVSHLTSFREQGYQIHIMYVWIANDDIAVARVASRVRSGGHNIPEDVIRRRYGRGIKNFWYAYAPLSDTWKVYDNSDIPHVLVAAKEADSGIAVYDPERWRAIEEQITDE